MSSHYRCILYFKIACINMVKIADASALVANPCGYVMARTFDDAGLTFGLSYSPKQAQS